MLFRIMRIPISLERVILNKWYLAVLIGGFLGTLFWARGVYIAGWETLGAATAKNEIETKGVIEAFSLISYYSRHFGYWNSTDSIIFGWLPGILSYYLPWLFWSQLQVLIFTAVSLWLLTNSSQFDRKIFLAAWLTSLPLISYSLVGYPYISGIFPYIFAFLLVFRKTSDRWWSFLLELFVWFLIAEISMHCYETAKTFFIVPLLAALTFKPLSLSRRIFWILSASISAYWVLQVVNQNIHELALKPITLIALFQSFSFFLKQIFLTWHIDAPFLCLIGVICFFPRTKYRAFWQILILLQLGLMLYGGINAETFYRPRRSILFLFCIVSYLAWQWKDLPDKKCIKNFILAIIFASHIFSLYHLIKFSISQPEKLTLPYTQSHIDYFINRRLIEDSENLLALARIINSRQVLFYGNSKSYENTTDPQALPERIFL
jgi:hypothetical protein